MKNARSEKLQIKIFSQNFSTAVHRHSAGERERAQMYIHRALAEAKVFAIYNGIKSAINIKIFVCVHHFCAAMHKIKFLAISYVGKIATSP
jgi:hypothetical protein